MKRMRGVGLFVALSALVVPSSVSAQGASIFVQGGLTLPTGDYGTYANTGWMGQAGVAFPLGSAGLGLGAGALFGVNNHEPPPDGDKTNLYGGMGFVQYTIGDPEATAPYVYGGLAYLTHSYKSETFTEDSASGLGATFGGGVGGIPLGGVSAFVEGQYLTALSDDIDGTDLFMVSVGVSFGVGG